MLIRRITERPPLGKLGRKSSSTEGTSGVRGFGVGGEAAGDGEKDDVSGTGEGTGVVAWVSEMLLLCSTERVRSSGVRPRDLRISALFCQNSSMMSFLTGVPSMESSVPPGGGVRGAAKGV